jgi:hypothetical protein
MKRTILKTESQIHRLDFHRLNNDWGMLIVETEKIRFYFRTSIARWLELAAQMPPSQPENTHCCYCGQDLGRVIDPDCEDVPAPDDDAAWEAEAKLHLPTCEWVTTRAHRLNQAPSNQS